MGNTSSNANQNRPSPVPTKQIDSPSRRQSSKSPSPNPNQPHRSLRTKKKSLELPDLALLSLTPAHSHQNSANSSPLSSYRRQPRTTSPIPIPIPVSNNGTINNASNTGTSPRGRQQNVQVNLAREADASNFSSDLLLAQPPSTHIPVPHHQHHPRNRGSPYFRGAPLQYNSTHSFASRAQAAAQPRIQEIYAESQIEVPTHPDRPVFIQETVHSTIPLALQKAEEELAAATTNSLVESGQPASNRSSDEPREAMNVRITWRGGGKSVVLARAGDDNWKGRQQMEPDDPPADTSWSTWVSLMPGTHHIRFIVNDQWRLADDLPTAVDDEGSLANYVAVPISGLTPPHRVSAPVPPKQSAPHPVHSFWSTTTSTTQGSTIDVPSSSDATRSSSKWTDEIPTELVAAAREEEAYLAYTAAVEYDQSGYANTHQVPAPNIPPAPVLPRHLDKLILNVKVGQPPPSRGREREREKEREKEREREHRRKQGRSLLGMTSTLARDIYKEGKAGEDEHRLIPIMTASGTDVTHLAASSLANARLGLDGAGLSDDASVLPVPSHVVLHHLSTSAIRNGVLAVGSTTRYRQKYLTTVYYKPT
ncbi:carbohydrate-binding module family 48 protein [Boletus edulis]|uniref:5'-AMP-activated protein kinase beta subunit, interation domain-containing protein n=1 Tax=Boletus edulis BED1 TaxID=1328754 RepID=A0AAD4BYU4_BOLED|nr:carbohydrate-binding module family 48 protein [Boletus edulis]KAF8443039.1 5'-AMP-activated protein kinase beta subunit, interation domain-containing protein [Boletus edulis BED1]